MCKALIALEEPVFDTFPSRRFLDFPGASRSRPSHQWAKRLFSAGQPDTPDNPHLSTLPFAAAQLLTTCKGGHANKAIEGV